MWGKGKEWGSYEKEIKINWKFSFIKRVCEKEISLIIKEVKL